MIDKIVKILGYCVLGVVCFIIGVIILAVLISPIVVFSLWLFPIVGWCSIPIVVTTYGVFLVGAYGAGIIISK